MLGFTCGAMSPEHEIKLQPICYLFCTCSNYLLLHGSLLINGQLNQQFEKL
jgi:hypothetical protein